MRAELPGAPDEVKRAAMAVEEAAGKVVTAASQGNAEQLDRATSRFGTAWSSLRLMQPAPHAPEQ